MKNIKLKSLVIIVVVSFGHFWHDMFSAFIIPLLPVIRDNFQLDYLHAGWILVAVKLPSLLSANIAGLAEKHNPKWFVIISPLVTSIAVTLLGVAPNYYVLLILVFISGLSAASFHIPAPTLLKKSAPNNMGAAMTSFQIGGELARTLGPIFVVLILSYVGFNKMYYLIPISVLVSLFFYMVFNRVDVSLDHKEKKRGSVMETIKAGKWLFLLVGGISIQKALVSTVMRSFLPLYLRDSGESLLVANGALAIVQGAAVAGVIVAGLFIDKVGPKKILYVVIATSMLFLSLFVLVPALPTIPLLILIGFFSFASMPAIYTLIQSYGFEFPTTANGVFMSLNFGISSLILLLGGKVSDMVSINFTYRLFAYLSFVGIPLLFMLKREKTDH